MVRSVLYCTYCFTLHGIDSVKLEKNLEYDEAVHQLFVANNTARREDLCNTVSAFGVRMKPITLLKMCQALRGNGTERNGTQHLLLHLCDMSLFWRRIREVDRGRGPLGKTILQGILKK